MSCSTEFGKTENCTGRELFIKSPTAINQRCPAQSLRTGSFFFPFWQWCFSAVSLRGFSLALLMRRLWYLFVSRDCQPNHGVVGAATRISKQGVGQGARSLICRRFKRQCRTRPASGYQQHRKAFFWRRAGIRRLLASAR